MEAAGCGPAGNKGVDCRPVDGTAEEGAVTTATPFSFCRSSCLLLSIKDKVEVLDTGRGCVLGCTKMSDTLATFSLKADLRLGVDPKRREGVTLEPMAKF